MKICFAVTNDIVTDQRVNRIARSLLKTRAEVLIAGRKKKGSPDFFPVGYKIKRFRLFFNRGPLFYACYNIRLFIYLLFHRADIVVSNDLDTLPACYLASKIGNSKLVYDSHELFTEVPELIGRKHIKKIWETIEGWILPKVTWSYTVCQSIAEYYHAKYDINMQVIRNMSVRRVIPVVEKKLFEGNERIILYQGSVNMGRGLEMAIGAMKYLENARLVIIGDGDVKKKLEKQVFDEGLSHKVTFTGRIPGEELYSYTTQAEIGISLEENLGLNYNYALPNKLFDYIQARVPVLVSDFPEMGGLVKKYDIGLTVISREPEKIAEAIDEMFRDTERLSRWKENLEKAAGELCWENEEPKLIKFFSNIL